MWTLDYDGAMLMRMDQSPESFVSGSFYKLFLRRYVREVLPGLVRFKPALSYLDLKRIIELCRRECEKKGVALTVGTALTDYIEGREMHIELRSRLGIELKDRDEKLRDRFLEYGAAVDAHMARKLRERQMWDSFFMCAMQRSANFSVPGSGKTASVLGMYAYLKSRGLVRRVVVICPKNAFGSWMDEFTACFGTLETLRALNIHDPAYTGAGQRLAALKYDSGRCNLILVNYEAAGSLIEGILPLVNSSALLVFDEVHKVKRVNGRYARQALRIARDASYVAALTGTPIPNSYLDIYNLLHILYPDEYEEFFDFSEAMLRAPDAGEIRRINDRLQPFFCRTTKDQLGVPPANEDILEDIDATEAEERLFGILRMMYRKKPLALLIRLMQLETDPRLLLERLDLSDFAYLLDDSVEPEMIDYADHSDEVRRLIWSMDRTTKSARCVELAASLAAQGKSCIIWCIFVRSIDLLADALRRRGIRVCCIYGEVPLEERQAILARFRTGEVQVLLTNPHTLAESVSLHSVCHDAIYYEYSYNLVHLLQSRDRIHRLGLPQDQYTQYYFERLRYRTEEGPWSLGEAIYDRLKAKERIMLDAIAERRLEVMPTTEEDLAIIFGRMTQRPEQA